MKLSKESLDYIQAELQRRLEVLEDLREQTDEWEAEYMLCEQVIGELNNANL